MTSSTRTPATPAGRAPAASPDDASARLLAGLNPQQREAVVHTGSPLLIVAENGLPLPVEAKLQYDAPDGARLNTPKSVRIPAKGSITVSMTADMPKDADRTDIGLWLATPKDQTISQPITISVQTRAGIVTLYAAGIAGALALVLATLFRLGRHRRKNHKAEK